MDRLKEYTAWVTRHLKKSPKERLKEAEDVDRRAEALIRHLFRAHSADESGKVAVAISFRKRDGLNVGRVFLDVSRELETRRPSSMGLVVSRRPWSVFVLDDVDVPPLSLMFALMSCLEYTEAVEQETYAVRMLHTAVFRDCGCMLLWSSDEKEAFSEIH